MEQMSRKQMCESLGITEEQLRSLQEDGKDESFKTNENVTRIVLVGKTGSGKSATGNTILGGVHFKSKFSPESLTVDCSKAEAMVGEQMVAVIDTPGFFDTSYSVDKTSMDIRQCISFASPGPHIFLVVIRLGRFTDEEAQSVQCIQETFGPAADKYSMVLFTHGDLLDKSIEDFLKESKPLQDLVSRCNGQYQVFNNQSKDNSQVIELLQKIRTIVDRNGGHHYTNEMFQEAEKAIEREKQRILAENEEKIREEREQIKRESESVFDKKLEEISAKMEANQECERKRMEKENVMEKEMEKELNRRREMDLKKMEEYKKMLEEQMNADLNKKIQEIKSQTEEKARAEAEKSNLFIQILMFLKNKFLS